MRVDKNRRENYNRSHITGWKKGVGITGGLEDRMLPGEHICNQDFTTEKPVSPDTTCLVSQGKDTLMYVCMHISV